jgi:hypothetical protein
LQWCLCDVRPHNKHYVLHVTVFYFQLGLVSTHWWVIQSLTCSYLPWENIYSVLTTDLLSLNYKCNTFRTYSEYCIGLYCRWMLYRGRILPSRMWRHVMWKFTCFWRNFLPSDTGGPTFGNVLTTTRHIPDDSVLRSHRLRRGIQGEWNDFVTFFFRGVIRRPKIRVLVICVTKYGLEEGWIAGRGRHFISSLSVVYWIWAPYSILFSG